MGGVRVICLAALASVALFPAFPGTAPAGPASAQAGFSQVFARYDISFNGLSIGTFSFHSNLTDRTYELDAKARISLLKGMLYEWKGHTRSAGLITTQGPRPALYRFNYESGDNRGKVELDFDGDAVRKIIIEPPHEPSKRRVPVQRHHKRGVIDPLSAVMLLSQVRGKTRGIAACDQRLRIFDGNMRYDLQLSYKKSSHLDNGDGYTGLAYVCRVKFIPIAGHKATKKETNFMARTDGIEVWLVPAHNVGLYVPYRIVLPLPVGYASMTPEYFRVEAAGQGRITVIDAR